jgi:hypothetical protein
MAETVQQFSLWSLGFKWRFAMSLWDAFIDDYERRRKNLLKRIQLMEARLIHTGNSELGRWITTTADSLEQAKVDLAEIERLLEEAKAKLRSGD